MISIVCLNLQDLAKQQAKRAKLPEVPYSTERMKTRNKFLYNLEDRPPASPTLAILYLNKDFHLHEIIYTPGPSGFNSPGEAPVLTISVLCIHIFYFQLKSFSQPYCFYQFLSGLSATLQRIAVG